MDVELQKRNILIILGTFLGVGILIAIVKTWKWFSETGRIIIDLPTIGKFILYVLGISGTVFLFVTAGVSIWWLVFYKREYENNFARDTSVLQDLLKIFLIVSFALKTLDIFHLIIRQTGIEIFFMDWERPITGNINDISIWRTYFVANEFHELGTIRRINLTFQLFFILFFLKVINFENISYAQSEIHLFTSEVNATEYNQVFRTGIGFLIFLGTGFIQYLVYTIIYQRFIADQIYNFIDLCSVSNISVFILDENYHGYYIHGRSPHGRTDVNIKEMLINFDRERKQMTGTRGLQNNSNDQIFIMKMNQNFRRQYELLLRNYNNYLGRRRTKEDAEQYTTVLLQSYQNLNRFLCRFLSHSFVSHSYSIRNRYLLEKILNYEFQIEPLSDISMKNLLLIDNEKTFTKIFFYGEESSLFIWNMITFLFIDVLISDYILAAIITYLINYIIVALRNSFGRKNLSKKTLIPREFLI